MHAVKRMSRPTLLCSFCDEPIDTSIFIRAFHFAGCYADGEWSQPPCRVLLAYTYSDEQAKRESAYSIIEACRSVVESVML